MIDRVVEALHTRGLRFMLAQCDRGWTASALYSEPRKGAYGLMVHTDKTAQGKTHTEAMEGLLKQYEAEDFSDLV